MRNKSVLAISVALALTACGSSDDTSSDNSGLVITGFDGYLKNAVVFVDSNGDGLFSISDDKVLGLTDKKGQVNLGNSIPSGTLALQTLVLGQAAQQSLSASDSSYSNIFTVDMDRPSQSLTKEFVLQSVNASRVISPITDLIVLEMKKSTTDNPISEQQAIANVQSALGLSEDTDLYSDFVSGNNADPYMHKVAQLLADSKAEDPYGYENEALEFAKDAKQSVDAMSPDEQQDPNFRAPVNGDISDVETPNHLTYVDDTVAQAVQKKFDALTLEFGQTVDNPVTLFSVDVSGLFKDKDVPNIYANEIVLNTADNYSILDNNNNEIGLIAYIRDDQLHVGLNSVDPISVAGSFNLELKLVPDSIYANIQSTFFSFEVVSVGNTPAQINEGSRQSLQAEMYTWSLLKGVDLGDGYTLDFSELFTSASSEEITLSFSSDATNNGLIFGDMSDGLVSITGAPLNTTAESSTDYTLSLLATSAQGLVTTVNLNLPDVLIEGLDISVLEDETLYRAIFNKYSGSIRCEKLKLTNGVIYSAASAINENCPSSEPSETLDQYSIVKSNLLSYSDKYPLVDATPRVLLSAISFEDINRYLITNGVNASEEWNAIEYFDSAVPVNKMIQQHLASESTRSRDSYVTLPIEGEHQLVWLDYHLWNGGASINMSSNERNITCEQIGALYESFKLGIIEGDHLEYRTVASSSITATCEDHQLPEGLGFDFVGLSLDTPTLSKGDYIHELVPSLNNVLVPKVLRFMTEDRG